MRKLSFAVVAALVFSVTGTARAADTGFSLGARLGFALPLGDVSEGVAFSDYVTGAIPLWIDATYRFTPNFSAGLYGSYAYGLPKNCPAGASCSGYDLRFGAEALYHFSPEAHFSPWVGIGTGYESLSATINGVDLKASGWEYVTLQAGGDVRSSPAFTFGPFATFSIGKYGSFSGNGRDIPNVPTSTHMWLQAGLRGTFDF